MNHYILDENGQPKLADTLDQWAEWYEVTKCRIAYNRIGISFIWTMFNPTPTDPQNPKFWRTQVQGGPLDTLVELCGGMREQADAQHAAVLARVQKEYDRNNKPN